MFGVDSTELLVIALIAVVVIGPKDLPRVMRAIGKWVGKARGMANQFKSGVTDMVRDTEIADLEKKWREQNDAIMRANPLGKPDSARPDSDWGVPSAPPAPMSEAAPLSGVAPAGEPVSAGAATRRAPGAPPERGNGSVTPSRDGRAPADIAAPLPTEILPAAPEPVPAAPRTAPRAPGSVAPARPAPRAPVAP